MRIKPIYIVLIVFVIEAGIIFTPIAYWLLPLNVKLTKVQEINIKEKQRGTLWYAIQTKDQCLNDEFTSEINEVDFKKYTLIISVGRELKSLKYRRITKHLQHVEDNAYIGRETFRKTYTPYTIYVYKVRKIELLNSEQAEWG